MKCYGESTVHIPDGFLDTPVIALTYAIAIAYLAVALVKTKASSISTEKLSLAPVLAAGIFAAQMLNWPIPGGTSLHFVGGALAGILLGPWLGSIVLFLVLLVQCLVFHDGGITALGANTLNMAIIDVLIGYACYRAAVKIAGDSRTARLIGAFIGGWLGITIAGIACGFEIGYSSNCPYGISISVPVMGLWHAGLGIIEGIITTLVVDQLRIRAGITPLAEALLLGAGGGENK